MKISAIGNIGYNKRSNFKNNKISNSTNSIASENLITPSLNQLQAYSKISFRGRQEVLNFLNNIEDPIQFKNNFSNKTPIEDIRKVFSSNPDKLEIFLFEKSDEPILKLASDEQIKTFAEILGDKAPEVIADLIAIRDKSGSTALYNASTDGIKAIAEALGDKAPEVIAEAMVKQDKDGKTLLHFVNENKIKAIAEILGDKAPEVIAKAIAIQDKYGETALHCANAEEIKIIAEVLGDSAPEIMAKTIAMQNKNGNTILHYADAYLIKAYKEIFKEKTDDIFQKVLLTKNNNGQLPIHPTYTRTDLNLHRLETFIEVAPNATKNALLQKCGDETYLKFWKDLAE